VVGVEQAAEGVVLAVELLEEGVVAGEVELKVEDAPGQEAEVLPRRTREDLEDVQEAGAEEHLEVVEVPIEAGEVEVPEAGPGQDLWGGI